MYIITDYTTNKPPPKGCLQKFAVPIAILFVICFALGVYIYDIVSGKASERFEIRENKKLAQEAIPLEFRSYKYLKDLENTDKYEVIRFEGSRLSSYYFLPDRTLVMQAKYRRKFIKINTRGEIINEYDSPEEIEFYGSSLMKYSAFYPPFHIEDADQPDKDTTTRTPVITGGYSNWPVNGDTTLHSFEPISKIATSQAEIADAYEKADVTKKIWISGKVDDIAMLLHIGDKWYLSDYVIKKPDKTIHSERNWSTSTDLSGYMNIKYKKRNKFHRERMGALVIGGAGFGGSNAYWNGDAYIHLYIGKTAIPFKIEITETKHGNNSTSTTGYLDILNTPYYAIVNNCLIIPKVQEIRK